MIRLFRNPTAVKIIAFTVVIAFLLPLIHKWFILFGVLALAGLTYLLDRYKGQHRGHGTDIIVNMEDYRQKDHDIMYH